MSQSQQPQQQARRVVIFGNSGAGKSSLAKQLVAKYQLAHLDLDTLAWQATSPPTRVPLQQSKQQIMAFISQYQNWVIEGCYSDLITLILDDVEQMIFMDLPIADCVENAKNRPWEPHKYESKQAQDENLAMLIDWIKQYQHRDDSFSKVSHQKLFRAFNKQKLRIIVNQRDLPTL